MNKWVDISFHSPWWLLLGLLVPLMIWWYVKRFKKNQVSLVYAVPPIGKMKRSLAQRTVHFPFVLRLLALVFFIIAMARPQGFIGNENRNATGIDVVFSLDVSYSMLAKDLQPTRLEVAKGLCVDFVKNRKEDRFGLVVFSGVAVSKTPLTLDHSRLMKRIEALKAGILEDGTHIGLGLGTAVARLEKSEAKSKVVILLTDGMETEDPVAEVSPMTAAQLAASMGIRVYVIGIGTRGYAESFAGFDGDGEPIYMEAPVFIDEPLMQQMASTTGGKYFRAVDNETLAGIFKEIDVLEKSKLTTNEFVNKPDLFFFFVLIGGALFCFEFLLKLTLYRSVI